MNSFFMFALFLIILNLFLYIISSIIMTKSQKNREKNSPFECGFDPSWYTRSPFSMRFFLLAVIFLIFDIEIILLIPIISNLLFSPCMIYLSSSIIFLIILTLGLLHEWNQGSLNWM
uniref:NADH-ubiquinone oxidoreductase chain 3 n=2 Tax=Octopodidae TaxID=6647 RepID=A0A344AY53_9MOLL|nr:NADH dehydrogenase subunit 3 [Callistoctopus minor]YP_009504410.1 NADH dehydrogenase subunit 3 [Octopus variabilis]ADU57220.1 NADH dehydrogenase subunit 3 [Callistoctopus minor]AWX90445.1 NADH dehydrogenase subunit 3 [Octopus variabilis]AWX90549.1 NADH dehydrogenase subunit 3 [Octopus variabilis]AWX90627.1 NADH dehydrogenase subunit 3 [Octopus variabilis]